MSSLAALLLVLAPSTLGAQPLEGPDLTLAQAMSQALAGSPSLRAATAGAEAAGQSAEAARGALFPRITFTEGWQRSDQPVFVFSTLLASRQFAAANFAIGSLNRPDPIGYFHATLGVEQLLIDGGARGAAVDAARAQREKAGLAKTEASLDLAMAVTDLYGRLLAVQSQRTALVASLDAGREDRARAERRRDAGVVSEADVLALGVHVAELEQRLIQTDGDIDTIRASLNRLMGAEIDRAFRAVEPDDLGNGPLPSFEALMAAAADNRPELQRARVAELEADSTRRAARSALMPRVAAQAAFDLSGTRFADRASSWLVGGEMRWTIGTGGAERAQMRAAAAGLVKAQAEADDVRAGIAVDVLSALQQVRTARARRAVGQAAVAQARESQRIVRDRYDAGLAPVNDVLRAAGAVLDADVRRVSAIVDEMVGRARLDRAVGRPLQQ